MKLTQWFEDSCYRAFLELTNKEAERIIEYLKEQLEGGTPETLSNKAVVIVTDASGRPKNTAKGIITIAPTGKKFPIDNET